MKLCHTKTKYTLLAIYILLIFLFLVFIPNLLDIYLALIKLPKAEIHVHPKLNKNESQSLTFLFTRIMDISLIFIF